MLYVAVISVVFLAAGLAMLSKLGQGNSAALELAVARAAHAGRKVQLGVQEPRDFYLQQYEESLSSRR